MVKQASSPAETLPVLAGRDAIITQSRSSYGRPRAEVEREVQYLGRIGSVAYDSSMPSSRLEALGVSPEEVQLLMAEYPGQEITDQLDCLPYRAAKSPARFVVAAIEGK